MNRGELTYRLLKDAGERGLTTADLEVMTGLMDAGKAISDARRDWCSKREVIKDTWENKSFFGFFPRKMKRYFIANKRS